MEQQETVINGIAVKIDTCLRFPRFSKRGEDIVCKAGIVIDSNVPIDDTKVRFTMDDRELPVCFKLRGRKKTDSSVIQETQCYRYSGKIEIAVPMEYYTSFLGKRYVTMHLSYAGIDIQERLYSKWYYGRLINAILEKTIKIPEHDLALYFLAQKNGLSFTVREIMETDKAGIRLKVAFAFLVSRFWLFRKPILLFEKNAERYEESASVVYERLIDMQIRGVYYLLDSRCPYIGQIGQRYRRHIIPKYSFLHYLVFFAARTYIGTEKLVHIVDRRPLNKFIRYQVNVAKYNYVFLQHGVMYMVSLDAEQRVNIFRFRTLGVKSRIVVSSTLEADHFTNEGECRPEQIYLTGLPKYDRNVGYADRDKIAIILTWRPWEEAQSKEDVTQTTYYRSVLRIFNSIPEELRRHVMILPHPLVAAELKKIESPINDYIVENEKYDVLLRKVSVLITDYSSISYDAFYRGTNIVFDWTEKDECISHYGEHAKLMLTEELAFGDICHSDTAIRESVVKRYKQLQDPSYASNYAQLVSFRDGRNTDRLIECMRKDGFIPAEKTEGLFGKMPGRLKRVRTKIKNILGLVQPELNIYYQAMQEPINENAFLLEAAQGKNTNGNMFALLKEIEYGRQWEDLQPYFVVTKERESEARSKFALYGFKRVKLLIRDSADYLRMLATAKYLATDNSFQICFIKREGQVLLNTWHGTPLKVLGRQNIVNSTSIGNVQKNFFASDYLLFPNEYTRDVFFKEYMLDAFYNGSIILADYPRNQILVDMPDDRKEVIKGYIGAKGKKVYAYMPTWRGTGRTVDDEKQVNQITEILSEMDECLRDDEVILVNLHFLVNKSIDYTGFKHIKCFSPLYDSYEILSACDGLITDYSSVFFDYAITHKPIIMFTYDMEEYLTSNGTYFDMRKLPFPFAKNVKELIGLIRKGVHIDKEAYQMFTDGFCSNYVQGVSGKILQLMTKGETADVQVIPYKEDYKNVLLYKGSIASDDVQKSLMKEIEQRKDSDEVITLLFNDAVTKRTSSFLEQLPERVRYMRLLRARFASWKEALSYTMYERFGKQSKTLDHVIERERERLLLPFTGKEELICDEERSDTKLVISRLKDDDNSQCESK